MENNQNPFGLSDSAFEMLGFGLVIGAVLVVIIPLTQIKTV